MRTAGVREMPKESFLNASSVSTCSYHFDDTDSPRGVVQYKIKNLWWLRQPETENEGGLADTKKLDISKDRLADVLADVFYNNKNKTHMKYIIKAEYIYVYVATAFISSQISTPLWSYFLLHNVLTDLPPPHSISSSYFPTIAITTAKTTKRISGKCWGGKTSENKKSNIYIYTSVRGRHLWCQPEHPRWNKTGGLKSWVSSRTSELWSPKKETRRTINFQEVQRLLIVVRIGAGALEMCGITAKADNSFKKVSVNRL